MKPRIGLTTSTTRGGDGNGAVRFGVPDTYVRRVEEAAMRRRMADEDLKYEDLE